MNIGPVTHRPPEINVTDAVTLAYERVKRMLFQPFDINKWFVIGFCAWLAMLGEGGGFNGSYGGGNSPQGGGAHPPDFRHFYFQARDYVLANLHWLVPLTLFLLVLALALWVTLLWLSSRGKFMFLHCVALDRAEVQWPWARYAGVANSLFRFRLVLGLASMILFLPLMIFLALVIIKMLMLGQPNLGGILVAVFLALAGFVLMFAFVVVAKFLKDFIVPIMYLRNVPCLTAWQEFFALLKSHVGIFVLYLLFQIALALAMGVIILICVVATCCIAGCVMLLPYVGTVLLLPVLVFQQSYSLYFLSQFGPQYDVFPKSELPPAATSPFPAAG